MELNQDAISFHPVHLPRHAAHSMLRLVRCLFQLQQSPEYRARLRNDLPDVACFDPGHDAVMMGYDFHLGPEGPRLIEVNTNAGGAMYAYRAAFPDQAGNKLPGGRFIERFLATFHEEWWRFSKAARPLRRIAIIDETPPDQGLYPEMVTLCNLFRTNGVNCSIHDPVELESGSDGVRINGERVDLVYNRHCDFYLEGPDMAGIRAAYLAGAACLSPNPYAYGLLGDKRRMTLWSDEKELAGLPLSEQGREILRETVPHSRLLANLDPEDVWTERKNLIFKPVSRFGGKGVLVGRSISRKRFRDLDPAETLVQAEVPPSLTVTEEEDFKTDFRLFVYRNHCIGIAARLYRGQVTNLRTPGGGFARVLIDTD